MLPTAIKRKLLYSFIFPFDFFSNQHDRVSNEDREKLELGEITRDKLRDMVFDENGYLSKEIQSVITLTSGGVICGFLFGGSFRAKLAGKKFIEENQASMFENKLVAQKELQKKFTYEFFRGGKSLAGKLGMFCFLFSGTATCLYVVRNKFTVSNYTYAGITTGILMKLNMGIKGACAGAFLGGVLGSIYGSVTAIMLYVTGTEMNTVITHYGSWMTAREKKICEGSKALMSTEQLNLKHVYDTNLKLRELEEQNNNKVQEKK